MKLIVSIDTEEDNWGDYKTSGHTVKNIQRIKILQQVFNEFNVTPTYLISYPVAADKDAVSILSDIEKSGRCEIGMHCHPWNNPPFKEETSEKNSMLCNLPFDLQYEKLVYLHDTISKNFNITPVSFRSGRWGYSEEVAKNLHRIGYKVDTSITAYTDWTKHYGPNYSNISPQPFLFSSDSAMRKMSKGNMVEIPATVGYLQRNYALCNYVYMYAGTSPFNRLKIIGILGRLNMLNKIWLSPETSSSGDMILLVKRMLKEKYKIINMFFHSSSLLAGNNNFVKSKDDEKRFLDKIREFLAFTTESGINSITLSNTYNMIRSEPAHFN